MRDNDINTRYVQLFETFEKIEQNTAYLLLKNHNLFRLLKYSENDPLSMPMDDEIAQDMLIDFHSRIDDEGKLQWIANPDCRIFFVPFTDQLEFPLKSQLRIYPMLIDPKDIYIGELYVQVDVIVPLALEKIKNGRRKNRITSEVIKSFNGQEIGLINPLMIVDRPISLRQFKESYWGYSILFKTGVASRGK